jgi:hypothetical protein
MNGLSILDIVSNAIRISDLCNEISKLQTDRDRLTDALLIELVVCLASVAATLSLLMKEFRTDASLA